MKLISLIIKGAQGLFKYKELILVGMIVISSLGIGVLYKKVKTLKLDNDRLLQNVTYYQDLSNGSITENKVLRLTVGEFSQSNDILVQRIDSVRKALKISEKALKSAVTANQRIEVSKTDTVMVTITEDSGFKFTKEFKFNDQTISTVYYEHFNDSLKQDSIRNDLYITNQPTLIISSKREYRNKKNFFKRLITFDWRRMTSTNYNLVNSNDKLETDDLRVINIESK